jgi:hypothetical protein
VARRSAPVRRAPKPGRRPLAGPAHACLARDRRRLPSQPADRVADRRRRPAAYRARHQLSGKGSPTADLPLSRPRHKVSGRPRSGRPKQKGACRPPFPRSRSWLAYSTAANSLGPSPPGRPPR